MELSLQWSIDLLAPEKLPPQAKYLLGYNEPNHNEQAKLTPQEAAVSFSFLLFRTH